MTRSAHPLFPRPDADIDLPATEPSVAPAPLRARLFGRASRVVVWLLVLAAAVYGIDLAADLHMLPPWRSLLPWSGETVQAAPQVSAERIAQATDELDRVLETRLAQDGASVPPKTGTPGAAASKPSGAGKPRDRDREVADTVAVDGTILPLENPCTAERDGSCRRRALDSFYAALRRTALKEPGALTRITHYGDSVIIEDLWTSTVRRRLQERFGDGGPGFLFVARPWAWYGHLNVVLKFTEAWHTYRVTTQHVRDAFYGYGGVSFVAGGPGATVTYATAPEGTTGRAVSRLDVYYLAQPGGGSVEVAVDDVPAATFSTEAPQAGSAFHLVEMRDGPHTMVVRSAGGGPVRLFGVTLERSGPGVVYDGIGILGASARALLEPDEAHWREQYAHRRPDLVILTFGTNESDHDLSLAAYREQLRQVVRRIHLVAPDAACLLAGPPDRGDPNTHETRPVIPKIVQIQREVALETGCAFWDTYMAMGGKNTMWAWYRSNPRRSFGDLTHLAPPGGEILGNLLHAALLQGLVEYLER